MFRKLVIGALGAMAVLFSTTAFAQGTAADAKAMLEKTVAAIKADKAKTLDQINKGENGFLVGDKYMDVLFYFTPKSDNADASERLWVISVRGSTDNFDSLVKSYKEKYGKPSGVINSPVQNKMGATFDNYSV